LRVSWTLSPARLRRARTAFAFALILAVPTPTRAQDAPADEARARLQKARDLIDRLDYDQALVELDQALTLADADARLAGEIQVGRGQVLFAKRDWSGMRTAYETAADLFDRAGAFRDEARAMDGLVYNPELPWEQRERIIEHAVEVLRRDPDAVVEGRLFHRWGDILVNLGRYGRALEKLEEARGKLEGSPDESSFARLLTSLGRARRLHGQPEAALPYYRRALAIQTRLGDLRGAAQSENAMAIAYSYQGRWPETLLHAKRALALAERSGYAPMIAFNRLELGLHQLGAGQPRHALSLLSIADEALSPIDASSRLFGLSRAELALGRTAEAMIHAEAAMERARAIPDPYHLLFALEGRAQCHTALGHEAAALADAREAVAVLESMRTGLAAQDQARQAFADSYLSVFTTAITVMLRSTRDLEALEVAERARGRAFLDLLASRDLASSAAEEARDAQRRELANASPLSSEAMRAILARLGSTLVAYWVGSDVTVVWVLSPDGALQARRVGVSAARLRSLIRALAAPGAAAGASRTADPARVLYDLLLKPVEAWLPARAGSRLTIVPHGPLFALPFAALRNAQGRYLVERWATHYATSMSVLDRLETKGGSKTTEGAVIVADPALDPLLMRREALGPLPAAEGEAAAVAKRLDARPTTVLRGPQATTAAVKRAAEGTRVLHFATHAVVSDTRPLESFLALAPGDGTDGRLTSAEIYGWRLKADLVVLSACRTARGRVNGDGVIGLSRAFAYAGTPSLVATVWDAPDQTSRELFPTFYAEWQRTGDRAGALRTAQLALIRKLRAGGVTITTPAGPVTLQERPALWAPFVLLGEP
jgi:CHAT domain-containing protein